MSFFFVKHLTDTQKNQNKREASARICVEHINAKLTPKSTKN